MNRKKMSVWSHFDKRKPFKMYSLELFNDGIQSIWLSLTD